MKSVLLLCLILQTFLYIHVALKGTCKPTETLLLPIGPIICTYGKKPHQNRCSNKDVTPFESKLHLFKYRKIVQIQCPKTFDICKILVRLIHWLSSWVVIFWDMVRSFSVEVRLNTSITALTLYRLYGFNPCTLSDPDLSTTLMCERKNISTDMYLSVLRHRKEKHNDILAKHKVVNRVR